MAMDQVCPVLVWIQPELPALVLTVEYFESFLGCCPRDPLQKKAGMKMNE